MRPTTRNFVLAVASFALLATGVAVARGDGNGGGYLAFLVFVFILGLIYVAPALVVFAKDHPKRHLTLLLTLLLGWLLVPWIIALIWALRQPNRSS